MNDRQDIPSGNMPDEFDRAQGMLDGLTGVTKTQPSTIVSCPPMGVGGSRTYIVYTVRQRDEHDERSRSRDTVFLQAVMPDRTVRLALPPEVADAIARQRDALTSRGRSKQAKANAAARKAAGWKPNTEGLRKARGKRRRAK